MGLISIAKRGLSAASKVARNPMVQAGLQMIPGAKAVGTGLKVAGALSTAYGGYQAVKAVGGAIRGPATPGFTGGLPALPGVMGNKPIVGKLPMPGATGGFGVPRGPGGKMQLPWNDPSVPALLKQYSLDDSYIKMALRAPKGYVIVRDPDGQPYPMLKEAARKLGLWKPGKKPPISVGEHQSLLRAHSTIKQMKKIFAKTAYVEKNVGKGGKVKVHKHKKG